MTRARRLLPRILAVAVVSLAVVAAAFGEGDSLVVVVVGLAVIATVLVE